MSVNVIYSYGLIITYSMRYIGEFRINNILSSKNIKPNDCILHGKGTIEGISKIIYGIFNHGEFEYGKIVYNDGSIAIGTFTCSSESNKYKKLNLTHNNIHYGETANLNNLSNIDLVLHGKNCVYKYPNDDIIYVGSFENGLLINGNVRVQNEYVMQGTFKNNKLDGNECTLLYNNGNLYNGVFKDGEFISGKVILYNEKKEKIDSIFKKYYFNLLYPKNE